MRVVYQIADSPYSKTFTQALRRDHGLCKTAVSSLESSKGLLGYICSCWDDSQHIESDRLGKRPANQALLRFSSHYEVVDGKDQHCSGAQQKGNLQFQQLTLKG